MFPFRAEEWYDFGLRKPLLAVLKMMCRNEQRQVYEISITV
jgi:hypothetical protein